MLIALKDITKSFGGHLILDSVTFNVEEKEKVAIVGVNGAGKSTLLKIITKEIFPDAGAVILHKEVSVGYLPQNTHFDSEKTIYDEMLETFSSVMEMENEIRALEKKMQIDTSQERLAEYEKLSTAFLENSAYDYQSRIRGILKGLGFMEQEFHKPVCYLSGGQKTRAQLAKLLIKRPRILILDEPTNHLDMESVIWLEDFLKAYDGAVLLISHDRYFMDNTAQKIIEIENGKSSVYHGNYSYYMEKSKINKELLAKQYENRQKEIKRQEDIIKTLRSYNREKSVRRANSREKLLAKTETPDKPQNVNKIKMKLKPRIVSGNDVLFAENLKMSFDGNVLFENISFHIKRGEKIALIGPNGIGKTTLFKIIANEIKNFEGTLKVGVNVQIAYYEQEMASLNKNHSIMEEMIYTYPKISEGEIRNTLAAFVFTKDDVFKKISSLSGGEVGRLSLAKIMLSNANFLLLDEPTNHLDMYSKEILERALQIYEGSVLTISHDRYFIEKTAGKIFELTPSELQVFLGNYSYYQQKKWHLPSEKKANDAKEDWVRKKAEQALIRKRENDIKKVEGEIFETENQIEEINILFLDEGVNTDSDKLKILFEERSILEERLLQLYESWERLQ